MHFLSITRSNNVIFNRALFRAIDSAKVLELNAKKAFLKANLKIGSDEYTANIRLNTSALPENVALKILMQKELRHENLTKSIQLEFKHELQMLMHKFLGQEDLTKSIDSNLNLLKEVISLYTRTIYKHSTRLVYVNFIYEYDLYNFYVRIWRIECRERV